MFIVGELVHNQLGCPLQSDNMEFNTASDTFSQIVISESAASCWAENLASSKIGKLTINSNTISKMTGNNIQFYTESIYEHLPLFAQKLGNNTKMAVTVQLKDISILFGQFDSDVIVEYTLATQWSSDNKNVLSEVMYDELKIMTSFDLSTNNDILFFKLNTIKLQQSNINKDYPLRDKMNITYNEYKRYLKSINFALIALRNWLNRELL